MNKPKRVALIGLDGAVRQLVEKHVAEGVLPNIAKLINNGTIAENALSVYPTITPPNWATLATGCWPGTHNVTDFWKHIPGTVPDNANILQAFSRDDIKAETIWEVVDKLGKKAIVFNYPMGWPSHMDNGVVVGGMGLSLGTSYIDVPFGESHMYISSDMCVTDQKLFKAAKGTLSAAKGWSNVDDMGDEPLEASFNPDFPSSVYKVEQQTWYILIRDTDGTGYNTITLSPSKDFSKAFCTLKHREWSEHVYHTFTTDKGEKTGYFLVKAEALPEEGEGYKLFITAILEEDGWASPAELAKKIKPKKGIPGSSSAFFANLIGWVDDESWLENNLLHCQWNGSVATQLMQETEGWELFYMHIHNPDWMYHKLMSDLCPTTSPSDAIREKAEKMDQIVWTYLDDFVGKLVEAAGPETMFVLVADHGATTDGPTLDPFEIMINAGLSVKAGEVQNTFTSNRDGAAEGGNSVAVFEKYKAQSQLPLMSESKAIPQRSCFIYVNLKSRYAEGIVDDADYAKVQEEIIDALYAYRHPTTGERMISIALTRNDARMIGLYGDHVGDVVYAVHPKYSSQHGPILSSAEYGVGSVKPFLVFSGPGVKQNLRLQRSCWLTDIVPTICQIMEWPVPNECEGAVLYQLLDK